MKINVTQDNIDNGRPECPWACPVALACKRVCGDESEVEVSSDRIIVGLRTFDTPQSVYRFIIRFDAEQPVQPFEFELPDK